MRGATGVKGAKIDANTVQINHFIRKEMRCEE